MADSSINMKFTAQTADAQARIADLEKEVTRLNNEVKKTKGASEQASSGLGGLNSSALKAAAVIATVVAAVKAVVSVSKELINSYRDQELSQARLQSVLKATGNQIGMTVGDLKDLASATQSVTRFGDEAVMEAEKLLIATQSLDKDGLQRAIMASADLAEAMGEDIVSAASTMAYALQDPVNGLTRLRRQGIAFTETEAQQIQALSDANDLYGAQALILDKVESKYKGVAAAVAETNTGKLDKIKNVWGDIKEGLGQGLLDSISPALETLYGWLSKISSWVADVADLNSVSQTLKSGGSLASFPTPLLERALREYDSAYNSNNPEFRGRQAYLDWQKLINQELAARQAASVISPTVISEPLGSGSGSEQTVEETVKELTAAAFLKTYGSGSLSYRAASYQNIIDQATAFRSQMVETDANGTLRYSRATREAWGIEDPLEFAAMYKQLGEVIEDATEKKAALYKTDETAVRTMKDFLEENTTLSKTAQVAAIDAKIAEAESWQKMAESGSQELSIIEEIIDGLNREKEALEKTGETSELTTQQIISGWSNVASKVGDVVSATSGYMKQIWNQQADDLEAALERDKKTGELSEKEEQERLKAINDMRRKSFEADKANAITQALINAAQGITAIWSQYAAQPVVAAALTALSATATGIQIATIENQQFTPMAKGGIVTQATPIIAGEAGPEAIIPLSGGRGQQYLNNGVTINITIQGNADEDVIFHAIERAQRTGYLPNWQYV